MAATSNSSSPLTKTLTASCHCKSVQYILTVSTSQLPLKVHICHCSICRYTHGMLATFHAPLPEGVIPQFAYPSSRSNLTTYVWGKANNHKHFCSTCGCHIGDEDPPSQRWVISSAIFDANRDDPGEFDMRTHVYTESCPGGGLFQLLPKIGDGDRAMEVWNSEEQGKGQEGQKSHSDVVDDKEPGKLHAKCHCGGVSFNISRPTQEVRDDPNAGKLVSSVDPNKWVALFDLCDDCRLVNGTNVMAWTFATMNSISPSPADSGLKIGSSKVYESGNGVKRAFCSTCGATVFYWVEKRPSIVNIAVGLLRAPKDVMAEEWLTWLTSRVWCQQDGDRYDPAFARAICEGLSSWGRGKSGSVA